MYKNSVHVRSNNLPRTSRVEILLHNFYITLISLPPQPSDFYTFTSQFFYFLISLHQSRTSNRIIEILSPSNINTASKPSSDALIRGKGNYLSDQRIYLTKDPHYSMTISLKIQINPCLPKLCKFHYT